MITKFCPILLGAAKRLDLFLAAIRSLGDEIDIAYWSSDELSALGPPARYEAALAAS